MKKKINCVSEHTILKNKTIFVTIVIIVLDSFFF